MVVATRSAGIWRIVNGEWRLFAEGLFDSLGVVVEDGKGLVVVAGQKAELTRIRDTNGDGIADKYETLFDAHSYHAQLPQLHARPRARRRRRLLLRAQSRARRRRHRVHGRRQRHGHLGRLQRLGRARRAERQVRVVRERPAQPREPRRRAPTAASGTPTTRATSSARRKCSSSRRTSSTAIPPGLVDLPGMTPDSPEIQLGQSGRPPRTSPSSCSRTTASRIRRAIRRGSRRRSSARSPARC